MKKVSLLVAILAITVAVGSAFTTKSKVLTTQYAIFGVTQDAVSVNGGSPSATDAFNQKITDDFFKTVGSATTFATEKANWNSSHVFPNSDVRQVRCNQNDTDEICGAAVTYDDANPSYSMIDFEAGDYSLAN